MQFSITEYLDIEKFTQEVNEDMSDLTAAMRTQTARAAYYGVLLSQARTQESKAALIAKSLEARLTKRYRESLTKQMQQEADDAGVKKAERVTIDMVKAEVALDPQMMVIESKLLQAQEIKNICQVAYDAFRTRRDMIVSLGHMTRAEMNSKLQGITNTANENKEEYQRRRAQRQGSSE